MKYALLIYSRPATWTHPLFLHQRKTLSDEERDGLMLQFTSLLKELVESGELVDSAALASPASARTVRVRAGVPATTDGPIAETRDHLAGYFVIDCASPERAAEIAARFPDAQFAGVEVRPIMDLPD